MIEYTFASRTELFDVMAADASGILQTSVKNQGHSTFVVSGGNSPMPLYDRLSKVSLPWNKISIALADERWVGVDHEASNEKNIRASLLQHHAASAPFLGMKNTSLTPQQGLSACEEQYRQLPQPIALSVLGLGSDGHTASLFPFSAGIDTALDVDDEHLCAAIDALESDVTGRFTARMTMSLRALLSSRHIYLLIMGEDKRKTLQRAMSSGDQISMPIRAVLQQQSVPVSVYWAP